VAVFAIAGNPNKPTMFPTSRPGIHQGNGVIYGGLVGIIYVQIWPLGISWRT